MSSNYYKVAYTDNYGSMLSPRDRHLYVHEHNTSDVTTIYNEEGDIVYCYSADNEEEAQALARIILGQCQKEYEEHNWNGKLPNLDLRKWREGGTPLVEVFPNGVLASANGGILNPNDADKEKLAELNNSE